MLNSQALQEHIKNEHKSLVARLADIVESLQNPRYPTLYDTGLWFSPESHVTIIYLRAEDPQSLSDCTFQMGAHGQLARELTSFDGKYSDELSLEELDEELINLQVKLLSRH